jgi:hypothetical protein
MSVPLQAQEQQHCLLSYSTARKNKSENTLKQKSMHVGLQYPEQTKLNSMKDQEEAGIHFYMEH